MSVLSIAKRRMYSGLQSFRPSPTPTGTITFDASIPEASVGIAHAIKRATDIFVSSALLLALSPVLAAVALAIKLTSSGPIFFRQQRYGLNSDLFPILKFRTMYVGDMDVTGVKQTRDADPRVTPLGRFLRRTNLDELPQLINVLRGDMSLVGPRPHVPGMLAGGMPYEMLVPTYFERHRMRPGMTGLAQINELRGSTTDAKFARARIAYDIAYTENWSLLLDLRILWTTFRTEVLRGTGN
ncbi:sugar transferase [Hyphomicrobium sp. CS1GBMeth3]|uniref:sugar transferase n=1 Tax=Hyphomicrobium sp. CS1GBMeth3 TaxID=1892845 RepID=UPI000AC25633|nr:sugar transferase [Hyphomicrobium sp. CS1GBMeth3]